ncbi:hypothetical protein JCM33374_g1286 [Metschnikowia sp. JCM 33374]|nr:hypothetical protein JCM33374_g1286 [Metschnikowia sp. JCM 33374]
MSASESSSYKWQDHYSENDFNSSSISSYSDQLSINRLPVAMRLPGMMNRVLSSNISVPSNHTSNAPKWNFSPPSYFRYPYMPTQDVEWPTIQQRADHSYTFPPIEFTASRKVHDFQAPENINMASDTIRPRHVLMEKPNQQEEIYYSGPFHQQTECISTHPLLQNVPHHHFPPGKPIKANQDIVAETSAEEIPNESNFFNLTVDSEEPKDHYPSELTQESIISGVPTTEVCTSKLPQLPAFKRNISSRARKSFAQLIPSLRNVTAHNFSTFLAKLLKRWHRSVTIDEFFDLLYNENHYGVGPKLGGNLSHMSKTSKEAHGLEVFHLILETFRDSKVDLIDSNTGLIHTLKVTSVNFREFRREFFAMKVIRSCLSFVKDPAKGPIGVSRLSLYKVYFILCQRLLQQDTNLPNIADENLILGPSKLGKLTKSLYPNLISKRIGRRGMSKYHYLGFTWNELVVDEEILTFLHLDIPQLQEYFKNIAATRTCNSTTQAIGDTLYESNGMAPQYMPEPSSTQPKLINRSFTSDCNSHIHMTSYVNKSTRFPNTDCSPRLWEKLGSGMGFQSQWAKDNTDRSLAILMTYGVDLGPFIQRFNSGKFPDDNNDDLSKTFIRAMILLSTSSSHNNIYTHLFVVFLLVVMPVIIASDEEVPKTSKAHIRASIKVFLDKLECPTSIVKNIEEKALRNFTKVLRLLVSFNEMTSGRIDTNYTDQVLKEMIRDVDSIAQFTAEVFDTRSELEQIFVEAIIKANNAFGFQHAEDISVSKYYAIIENVAAEAKTLMAIIILSKDAMTKVPELARSQGFRYVSQDVPFQVFKIVAQIFHQVTLADPLVQKLPMQIITFVLVQVATFFQYDDFHNFAKRDPELSHETFRCWWMFSRMFQEYMSILSEVVAMIDTLDHFSTDTSEVTAL